MNKFVIMIKHLEYHTAYRILIPGMIFFHLLPCLSAQVIVKNNDPYRGTILEVNSTSAGILIPRLTTAQRISIPNPADGLLLYGSSSHSFWYRENAEWAELSDYVSFSGWMLTGNSGTNPANDYLGTSNYTPLAFRLRYETSGIIDPNGATCFGFHAGRFNVDTTITALGGEALDSNVCGWYNTAAGRWALQGNICGYQNTAAGAASLFRNISNDNTAYGSHAMFSNRTGMKNTAFGTNTLNNNYSGNENTAIGYLTLIVNTSGSANTAGGVYALNVTSESYNTAFGYKSLYTNSSGYNNTAFGYNALCYNNSNYSSTAVGNLAMYDADNTASGVNTMNTGIGFMAMLGSDDTYHDFGTRNTALGYSSLLLKKDGYMNIAIGALSLSNSPSARVCIAFGYQAMPGLTYTPDSNIAIGYQASKYSDWGHEIIAIGNQACLNHEKGRNTIGIGILSALNLNSYNNIDNIAIGGWALNNATASNWYNVCIGDHADVSSNGFAGSMALGFYATATRNSSHKIGNASVTSIGGYGSWSNYSDKRLKENIIYLDEPGLEFILKLKPATYVYTEDVNKIRRNGLIAQDVRQALNDLGQDFSGIIPDAGPDSTLSIAYSLLIIPLINAMQEQNETIEEHEIQLQILQEKINRLNAQ